MACWNASRRRIGMAKAPRGDGLQRLGRLHPRRQRGWPWRQPLDRMEMQCKGEGTMQSNVLTRTTAFLAAAILLGFAPLSAAQDKPANNLESVHAKLKADKKLIVTKYMTLTAEEAKKFWPVYEAYQKDLQKINQRLVNLLQSYAVDYQNQSLTDEKAQQLLDEWIAIETDDAQRRAAYVPKVMQALPPKKAARYLQIENEYRTLLKYDLATIVPLVQ
jgi:hypothetical protein